jgi:translocation and assembly module TamB
MRRLLLILGCLIVALAILVPGALLWSVLFTTAGAQFVVRHLPQQLGPVHLVIRGVGGTVAAGLHVEHVEIDHELVHLEFESIEGRVALMPLALQTIRVKSGSVHSALIEVKRRIHPTTPGPTFFLPAWMLISVEDARVDGAVLTVPNGFRLQGADIRAAAVIRHSYIRIFQAEGRLQDAHVHVAGELRAADPIRLDAEGRLDWTPAGQPNWMVSGTARGDLNALHILAQAEHPFRARFAGEALDLTAHWHWAGSAVVQNFDLSAWAVHSILGSITGRLAVAGDAQGFSARGTLNPTGLRAGVFAAEFSGSYADHVLTARQVLVRHAASGARASASGTLAIVENGPRLAVSGDWDDFRWPLVGRDVAVRSASGAFTLSGVLPYKVHLAGRGLAGGLSEMPVDVRGTLAKDSFSFDPAEIDLFGGHASVSGRIAWSPGETWSVAGRLTNINTALLRPDLPGNVSFTIGASGRGFEGQGELTAAFGNLSGKLRGVPASGSGAVTHSGRTWGFNQIHVALGSATLALDGHVSDRLNLTFAAAMHDLSLLSPGSRGNLKASGTVTGTVTDPIIVMSAHGGDFEYQGVRLESLDAEVNFNPQAREQESKIDVRLRKLTRKSHTVNSIVLTLRGPPAAYDVHLDVIAPGLAASAETAGAFGQGVFKGELTRLNVTGSEQLQLALERPVDLMLSAAHSHIEWLCLVGTPGSMCADGDWTPAAWSSTVTSNQLPLNTLTAGMTPAVEYLGTVSALAHLSGGATTPVQGDLHAELANAEIAHRLASHKVEHTKVGTGQVLANATEAVLSVQVDIGDSSAGTLHGRLEVRRAPHGASLGERFEHWQDLPLSGELHVQTDQCDLVSLYVPDIDRAAGHLGADVQIAGTIGAPSLEGSVKLSNGEIDVYQVNLSLRRIALEARLTDAGINFNGDAHAGAGEVAASGQIEWRKLLPYGKFHLQGTNLRVADVPEAQIDASPDLDFDINGRRIEVTGRVTVPYAKIQPKDITNAVRASPDEVIVGSEVENPDERFEVVSTVTLALGDKVSLDAMGLTARLTGNVTVRSGYDAITRGTGEFSVAEGQYTAYARRFDIQRGRLIFTGGPIDDPGIDVVAQKQFPDVTAGVKVRGTLTQPRMSFFSDPPLPQSQLVSLILSGGSLQSAQNSGNAALGQGAALLAAELGSRVGMPDVSLETDPIANETSLVLGRYLSPRLYVSYGVSLTEQLNVFKMRYTLGDHWTVRTELGTARGADLVYSIEK